MAQELKCIHICDRNDKHTEEQPLSTFLGFVRRPHYPDGWEYKTDEDGTKHWLCQKCVKDYYENFHKFMKDGKHV